MRRILRRLRCALGLHRPIFWYVFVSPKAPKYEGRTECLFCLRRLA